VVNRTVRHATEWEIALVQVVAARMAGFLEDDSQLNAGAGEWIATGASSGSWSVSGSDLRLTLDDRVTDNRESARDQQE
jgi:hypothetical protein